MGYRIKAPSGHDSLDEMELLSGMERFGLFLHEQRRALLVGLGVLLIAIDRLLGREDGRRRRLVGWAVRCERLERLPSRYWTGQFVCALARRR